MKKNKPSKFWRYSKVVSEISDISKKVKDVKSQAVKLWTKIDSMTYGENNLAYKNALQELQKYLYSKVIDSLRGSSLQLEFINDNMISKLNNNKREQENEKKQKRS